VVVLWYAVNERNTQAKKSDSMTPTYIASVGSAANENTMELQNV